MDDTDKLVAATLAAAMCSRSAENKPADYIDQYVKFLAALKEREESIRAAEAAARIQYKKV
jgi:hypothetical protein